MSLNMTFKSLIAVILLVGLSGCGSSQEKPTSDTCQIKKHWRDNVFQVLINDEAINKHYYTHDEAIDITKRLAADNKCMR